MSLVVRWIGVFAAVMLIGTGGCTKRVIEEQCCTSEYEITTQNYVLPAGFTLYIPQAFTPNSDGANDEFFPIGNGWKVESMVIKKGIRKVYESSNHIDAFWNGSGEKDGQYSYHFTFRIEGNSDLFDVEGKVCLFRFGAQGEQIPELERQKVCECILPRMIDPVEGPVMKNRECPTFGG